MVSDASISEVINAVKELRTGYMFRRDPCQQDIVERTGLNRETVAKALAFLENHSLIEVKRRGNRKQIVGDRLSHTSDIWM